MRLLGVGSSLAALCACVALAACGGGGGGGGVSAVPGGGGGSGPTPTPVPTATASPTPNASGYVAPSSGVTQLGPNAANQYSSSMLSASADGTFVVQSSDTPSEASVGSSLPEYDVTASESAAGVVPGSLHRAAASRAFAPRTASSSERAVFAGWRPRLDPRTSAVSRRFGTLSRTRVALSRAAQTVRAPQAFAVGAQRTFHVLQGSITGSSTTCTAPQIQAGTACYVDVPSTLEAMSNHAYVWVDNTLLGSAYGYSSTDWTTTGATFDTDYARETVAYGPAFFARAQQYEQCDSSKHPLPQAQYQPPVDLSGTDPHISMLVTGALAGTGEGGYFDFSNDLNDQELNCAVGGPHVPSNQLPMFVTGSDQYGTTADEPFWLAYDMPRTLPHEFQHYLHALNKVLIPELENNVQGYFDDSVVDEGCSELAEDIVLGTGVNPPQSWEPRFDSWYYLYEPGNFSIPSFTGYDANPLDTSQNPTYGFYHNTQGSYGGAYLLARYLYDRFGGDAAMHRLYADLSPSQTGVANLHPLVAEAGNGETFAQLYDEFAAALAARHVASSDPRFSFGSNVLLLGLTTLTLPGGTYNERFDGPRSPEDITSATPETLSRIKLTPSSTVHAKLISGATLFFNVAPSGGSLVQLNATSAPSNAVPGALVQGAYDDNGACLGPSGTNGCN